MYEKYLEKKGIVRKKPLNEEIKLDPKEYIISVTDDKGFITYANDYFVDISLYSKEELIGSPHNILRHPDMPKAIFRLAWETLQSGNSIIAIIKNLAKDGKHYWVVSEIEPFKNPNGNIIGYIAYRKAATDEQIKKIEPLYERLLNIELRTNSVEESKKYFMEYLLLSNKTYKEFINELVGYKGVFKLFFIAMKKIYKNKVLKELKN